MLYFGAPGRAVAVAVDEPTLAGPVRALFRPHVLDEGQAGDAVSADPVARVGVGDEGYRLVRPGDGESAFQSLTDLLGALEVTILRGLLAAEPDATHLHAAGAVTERGAMLALGPSGAGKSNLAMAWALAGFPLLGDDAVLMDPDGRVRALPRLVKVERGRLPELGIDPESTVAHDPDHPEVWIDPVERAPWADGPSRVAVVARIRFDGRPETRIGPLEPAEGLRLMLASVIGSGRRPAESVDRFIAAVEGATVLDVRFGRAADAARCLAEAAGG